MIDAFKSTYKVRLSLARDFTTTLALPTRLPYLPNGGLPHAFISQIRAFEICEPFLFQHFAVPLSPDADMFAEPHWSSTLIRLTLAFECEVAEETGDAEWDLVQCRWQKYTSADPRHVEWSNMDMQSALGGIEVQLRLLLDVYMPLTNARLEGTGITLTPRNLRCMQQCVSSVQILEPEVAATVVGWESRYRMQTREMAARRYRTACRDREEVGWEDC
jgi:hypothetical protein